VLPTEIRRRISVDSIQKWLMMALGTRAAAAQWVNNDPHNSSAATSLSTTNSPADCLQFFCVVVSALLLDGKMWE
jgi:hypothetical protein